MSRKSIAAFVRMSSHMTRDGEKIADSLEVCFTGSMVCTGGETERSYAPNAFSEILVDAGTNGTDLFENEVPVVCVYDGMYDLILSWGNLCSIFRLEPVARSSTDFFSITVRNKDGKKNERPVAIIFDLKHLMPRGLFAMAEAVGMERDGSAMQDCRIMRRYAFSIQNRHKLTSEEHGDLLGSKVTTLTGLARHEVDEELGWLSYGRRKGRSVVGRSLREDYAIDARIEAARTYDQYAMRRACMRGGLAFNAARESNVVHGRTVAIDETSAHHAQALCRFVPEQFKIRDPAWLQAAAERIVRISLGAMLKSYSMPFLVAMHAEIRFSGLRLRPGSVFERQEIGLVSTARFAASEGVIGIDNESSVQAERGIRERGFGDTIQGDVTCAFSKVMSASQLTTWVTEQELWCMSRVYTWDAMTVLRGEGACKWKRPDDLSILTSMHFWTTKQEFKTRIENEGDFAERQRLKSIYDSEIKPQFNAVGYGLHARDEYRPNWLISDDGTWVLEPPISPDDFEDRRPKHPHAWFNYGSRISGGARIHLIIAAELIFAGFGDKARIIAGDTDSLKIRTNLDTTTILNALKPLHDAMRLSIDRVTSRAATLWEDDFDPMDGVGEFVAERTAVAFYTPAVKEYVQIYGDGDLDLTCAGVPHAGERSFRRWLKLMVDCFSEEVLPRVFAYDVSLSPGVSQLSTLDWETVDNTTASLPRRIDIEYTLNSLDDADNRATVSYQRTHGRKVHTDSNAICDWTRRGDAVFYYSQGKLEAI